MGLNLKNPIIAGSSGLSENIDTLISLEKAGVAAVVLKSLFEEEILQEMQSSISKMNSESLLYPEVIDYYEYLDTPKQGAEKYLDLIAEAKKKLSIPVIASINCITASQWTYFPKRIEQAGADAIELNLFIMPSDLKRSVAENEKVYFDIINEVKKNVSIPISVKISYHFSNLAQMIKNLSETGIASIVLFNRFYSPDIDIEKLELTSGNVLSSPSDLGLSLRWVALMHGRVGCNISASTGIHDGKALIKQLLAGADTVQVTSAIYKNGHGIISEMLKELSDWMKRKNYNSIADFKGIMSSKNIENPAGYERVQFMKYFRGMKAEV
jgi:dihydroorotate dehydrogenase (fumarate)